MKHGQSYGRYSDVKFSVISQPTTNRAMVRGFFFSIVP